MSQNQHHLASPSSPSSSTGSTPLYRMFRGFKSTQVIAPPSTSAAWRATLNDLKVLYLEGRWKECESRCLRLVGNSKGLPVIHAYLMFLIGCCVDMHARNMHQYSAGKTKKMEDAAVWFERCEAVLTNIDLDGESKVVDQDVVVQTPEIPAPKTNLPVEESDVSPLVQKKERIERLTRTISRLIDSDLDNPFGDETDPFLSNNSTPQRTSLSNFPNWYASQHRLTPSPLRIRKGDLMSPTSQLDMLPSTPLSFGCVSTGTDCQDESMVSTPVQRDAAGLRCLASIMEDMSDCTWQSEKWNSAMGNGHDIQYVDAYEPYSVHSGGSSSVDGEDFFTYQAAREARIEAKKEALRAEIERRVAQRMHRQENHIVVSTSKFVASSEMQNAASSPFVSQNTSNRKGREMPRSLSDMIRDCLGKEEIEKMTDLCPRPIPHSSSAKPLPLCVKPRESVSSDSDSESDKASLARLEHAWEVASFDGVYMIGSDCHSLRVVERTWAQLRTQYHFNKAASHEDIKAHITRFDDQISSLLYSVRHDILTLRQLANDIKNNRAQHLQAQKLPPSRSYWSFSTPFKDVTDENTNDDSGDNDHHHHKRKTMDMRLNSGWAAPGAVLNENKGARIKRLRKEGFQTVGLRNEKRGHKGDEWYSYLCEEALRDIE